MRMLRGSFLLALMLWCVPPALAQVNPGTTPLSVPKGGTGIAAGQSGGVLCFNSTTTALSSTALAANGVVVGGGAGVCPGSGASQVGINGQVFLGVTSGAPHWGAVSGDATITNAGALAFATVNANVGTFGSATSCVTVTNNAKGLTTAISAANCTPPIGSITGLGTGIATALGVNIGSAGAPVLFNGAGGTPSSMTATNVTGLPLSTGVTGTLQAAQEPAHTGGCTNSAGSLALSCQINTNFAMGSAGNCGAIAANQTVFFGPNGCYNATEGQVQSPVSAPFTLKNFYASSFQAPGGSQSYILTVRKNAVSTSVTCTISAAATACNDTTHTASFAAADLIDVQIVLSASAAVAQPTTMATAVTTSP